ncbi:unnamed protein product [Lathyrus oleraceus]|uniref:Uncharacterized protein n=1 Tax=Pisum sativum TaxID=3888 RepID=A0A9D4X3N9_PEA|nr:uncharacterized protein LOC127087617 [Pisum sativum]KAI5414193.1 hypothetical protein KIW84_058362 [Pisum sativum]
MCDRDWVNLALADDSIVADTLLRFNPPQPPPPPPLHLHWTVRQPRSRSIPKLPAKPDFTRASPTTPLTWSAATSASEESSLPIKLTKSSRSKVSNQKETVTTIKNSKRKKTLAELKEEESFLLKERINLKNELASLRLTVEKEKATNERLKRMKLDFDSQHNTNIASASEICKQEPKFVLPDLNL